LYKFVLNDFIGQLMTQVITAFKSKRIKHI